MFIEKYYRVPKFYEWRPDFLNFVLEKQETDIFVTFVCEKDEEDGLVAVKNR